MCSAIVCSVEPGSAKLDGPVSKTGGSEIYKILDESSETMMTDPEDLITALIHYLENPGHITDRKVRC
jgi:hypothetical protein